MRTWNWAFYSVDALCVTDARARAFVAGGRREGVMAIDGVSDRLRGVWMNDCYPVGLLADSKWDKLYCLSEPNLVSVIDPATNSLLASIPVTGYPVAACINTVDHKVYVASVDWDILGMIAVLDGVGDTLLTEVPTYGDPMLLAFNSTDDVLYVAGECSHHIQAIDGKSDRVIDSCWVDEYPVGLVFNEAQHRLYCLGGGGEMTAITPGAHGANNYITVGAGLPCLALNSSGTRLYGGSPEHDSVYVVDCVHETLVGAVPVVGSPVAMGYDACHDRLYSASNGDSGALSVIGCAKNTVVATIPVASRLLYYDSTLDAVYCLGDSSLTVVDGQTCAIVRTFAMRSFTAGIASAQGWTRVYAADCSDSCLYVVRKSPGPVEMGAQAAADAQATVVRGSLNWAGKTLAVLFDMGGRRVADLHPGANDVSGLVPGVYFVRPQPGALPAKVLIVR